MILLAKYGFVYTLHEMEKNKRTDERVVGVRMGCWC
jgi:hypothetical protein